MEPSRKVLIPLHNWTSYQTYRLSSYTPQIVGNYSVSVAREVTQINTSPFSEYFPSSEKNMDLNEGLEDYYNMAAKNTEKNETTFLEQLLQWVNNSRFKLKENKVRFVCRRGILKKIGHTLYNEFNTPWKFEVCNYQGIVYIFEPAENHVQHDEYVKKCMYWGVKFERNITKSNDDSVYSSYVIVKSNIGKNRCLLGCEVDCVENDGSQKFYMEIKTCLEGKLQKKISLGWLQAFLAGNERIVYGLRNRCGYITDIKKENVSTLPSKYRLHWSGSAMMGLISSVLNKLRTVLPDGYRGVLRYDGYSSNILLDLFEGDFLPVWYKLRIGSKDTSKLLKDDDEGSVKRQRKSSSGNLKVGSMG